MQERLKRRLYRRARLIRRQPGLEGLENQREKKMTEISKSGIFAHSLIFKHLSCKDPPTGWVASGADPPALDLVPLCMLISSWQCLPQGAVWLSFLAEAHKNLTQFIGYQMDYRLIINSAVWLQSPVVYTTFLLCQPQHQTPWWESVEVCVWFFFVYVSVCVCKVKCRAESGCTKGMADLVLHSASFLELEQND